MKKYELTKETIQFEGKILYRIRALKAFKAGFGNAKVGDLGGYVESEDNLSQEDNCWIYDEAKVFDKAKIYGNALVGDEAEVYDWAEVFDNAKVYSNALIYKNAKVYDNAKVFDNAQIFDKKVRLYLASLAKFFRSSGINTNSPKAVKTKTKNNSAG